MEPARQNKACKRARNPPSISSALRGERSCSFFHIVFWRSGSPGSSLFSAGMQHYRNYKLCTGQTSLPEEYGGQAVCPAPGLLRCAGILFRSLDHLPEPIDKNALRVAAHLSPKGLVSDSPYSVHRTSHRIAQVSGLPTNMPMQQGRACMSCTCKWATQGIGAAQGQKCRVVEPPQHAG